MRILEVLQVRLKPNIQATSPTLLKTLSKVRSTIGTNSHFYQSIEDPDLLYILGEWTSLSAHQAFLASPDRNAILGEQDKLLEFNWMVHLPFEGMSSLPLQAPIMAIVRLSLQGGEGDDPSRVSLEDTVMMLKKYRDLVAEATSPWGVVEGWRCDGEVAEREWLLFTGWESVEAHGAFGKRMRAEGWEIAGVLEVVHVRDLERL